VSQRFNHIVARIVEGQIMSFLNDYPEIAEAWTGKRKSGVTKKMAVKNSLAKRIVRDLTCGTSTARLSAALVEACGCENGNGLSELTAGSPRDSEISAESRSPGVDVVTAPGHS